MIYSPIFYKAAAVAVVGSAIALNVGYADKPGAERALKAAGYADIETGDAVHGPFVECRGVYRTKFTAVGANGAAVEGFVCDGLVNNPRIVAKPRRTP